MLFQTRRCLKTFTTIFTCIQTIFTFTCFTWIRRIRMIIDWLVHSWRRRKKGDFNSLLLLRLSRRSEVVFYDDLHSFKLNFVWLNMNWVKRETHTHTNGHFLSLSFSRSLFAFFTILKFKRITIVVFTLWHHSSSLYNSHCLINSFFFVVHSFEEEEKENNTRRGESQSQTNEWMNFVIHTFLVHFLRGLEEPMNRFPNSYIAWSLLVQYSRLLRRPRFVLDQYV